MSLYNPGMDGPALLRTIRESPGDDAPRLVYADWLDDNGDPKIADMIRRLLAEPRIDLEPMQLAKSLGPNAVSYIVKTDVSATPAMAVAAVLRAIPFEFFPGASLHSLAAERVGPSGDGTVLWRVHVQYECRK